MMAHYRHGFAPGQCLAPACEHYPRNIRKSKADALEEFRNLMTRDGGDRYDLQAFERLSPYVAEYADGYWRRATGGAL